MAVPEEGLVSLLLNMGRVGTVYSSWQKATVETVYTLCNGQYCVFSISSYYLFKIFCLKSHALLILLKTESLDNSILEL